MPNKTMKENQKRKFKSKVLRISYSEDSPYEQIFQYLDSLDNTQKTHKIKESLLFNLMPEACQNLQENIKTEVVRESITFAETKISMWKQYFNLRAIKLVDKTKTENLSDFKQTANNNSFDLTEDESKESDKEYEKAMKIMDMFGE